MKLNLLGMPADMLPIANGFSVGRIHDKPTGYRLMPLLDELTETKTAYPSPNFKLIYCLPTDYKTKFTVMQEKVQGKVSSSSR
ncbi:MAG: hypothetical protein OXE41_02740 [Gammaproteobacteria bacterium]|nr:hypothetical protein [Gammaproteobacteria bacterium]MCY4219456.1 hypothetical protein [Gammaproteobacteria bacterium]MCY4274301.1 hypothetical protein [Gammaproteobacteria bacterium]